MNKNNHLNSAQYSLAPPAFLISNSTYILLILPNVMPPMQILIFARLYFCLFVFPFHSSMRCHASELQAWEHSPVIKLLSSGQRIKMLIRIYNNGLLLKAVRAGKGWYRAEQINCNNWLQLNLASWELGQLTLRYLGQSWVPSTASSLSLIFTELKINTWYRPYFPNCIY